MLRRLAILAVLTAALLSAKSYKIDLAEPAHFGSVSVPAGQYRLEVEGTSAVLRDKSGKEVAKASKIDTAAVKHNRTTMVATKEGDKLIISAIKLTGTNQTAVFE